MKNTRLTWSGLICLAGLSCASLAMADNARHGMGAMLPKLRQPVTMPEMSAANIASAPPSSVDLSRWAVAIGDQGAVNSCVGWTVAHDLAGWYANFNGKSVNLFAPMYVYSQINGGVDEGADPMDAFRLSVKQGIDTEQDYFQGNYDWNDLPTDAERANAARFKPQLFKDYTVLFSDGNANGGSALSNALKVALANRQPVAISFPVRPGFDNMSPSNPVDRDSSGTIRGYHEVLAVGYNADGLLIQNHWGTQWGNKGYGILAWSVVEHDIDQAIVATANH
ncbi:MULTISPECIES: C1 family peptidase [unclassified Xanthomonas]|uniref:C1 family peptidase n=1 Tax=unclassified Xanthomonas TaxID=2643310 RepID=UPI00163B1A9E|nr:MULTISPECIES: C1 family peptidase [unclassified Xanthomonas]QNH11610.1 cysteine protease [Xanthomonas sp. SI]QNH15888.1 cysteine protease [Xanthomonas sp. SS]